MISASLSLSLPRLGWKSTSMPRSLKICTAAGDSASEMRTLGFDIWCSFTLLEGRVGLHGRSGMNVSGQFLLPLPVLTGRGLGRGAFANRVRSLRDPHPDCCA